MDNLLHCAICFEMFNSITRIPRILNCGHTFCSKCLKDMASKSTHKENFNNNIHREHSIHLRCPLDKKVGFENMNTNDMPINRLIIDIMNEKESKEKDEQLEKKRNEYLLKVKKEAEEISSKIQISFDHLTKIIESERDRLIRSVNIWYQSELKHNDARKHDNNRLKGSINCNSCEGFYASFTVNPSKIVNQTISDLLNAFNLIVPSPSADIEEDNEDEVDSKSKSVSNSFSLFSMNNSVINEMNPKFLWFKPNSSLIYEYSLAKSKWDTVPNKSDTVLAEMFRVCPINSTEVLITGGIKHFICSGDVILYSNGSFIKKQSMLSERRAHSLIKIEAIVYAIGGIGIDNKQTTKCEAYSLSTGQWRAIRDMPQPKSHTGLCSYATQSLYLFGGETLNDCLSDSIEKYLILSNSWESLRVKLPLKLECCSCVYIKSSKGILILGGYSSEYGKLNTVYIFSPKSYSLSQSQKTLQVNCWSVFYPFQSNNFIHLFIGGEEENPPHHYPIDIDKVL